VANDIVKRLLARIRELREARGLSQETFAEHAGLKYKHYQAVEAGRKPNIQLPTLIKIAKALSLEPWELLNFDAAPAALAEDPAKSGYQQSPGKGARKSPKRLPREKKA